MNKISTLTFFFFIIMSTFGQVKIENTLTNEHKWVLGTKISIIPPKGFVKASNFLGFQQNNSGSSIMVVDIPGPFSEISKGMTKKGFLSQGVEVKKIENIFINNNSALFVTGVQNAYGNNYTKFILVFGSEKETIMINAVCPENLKQIGNELKKSLFSVYYDADKKINPFETVDFNVDITSSNLVFAKSMMNSLIYTNDGLFPTKSPDKSTLIITKAFSKIDIEDKKLFSINRLKQTPLEIEKIESTDEISIDGISGYKIIGIAKDKKTGRAEKICQIILFSDNLYYLLFATTNCVNETRIIELQKVMKTFKRR